MKKSNVLNELICDDLSDEAIYAIYQFLENLLFEFEGREFYRIRRHSRKIEQETGTGSDPLTDDML